MNGLTIGQTVNFMKEGDQVCVLTGRILVLTGTEAAISESGSGMVYWADYDWITPVT